MGVDHLLRPPRGSYCSTEEWLETQSRPDQSFKQYYESRRINLRAPKGIESPLHWIYRPFNTNKYRPKTGYVLHIPDGRVCREKCSILTPDHKVLWDLSWLGLKDANDKEIYQLRHLPPIQKISGTAALLGMRESGVYYHWMVDVLPRIHLLKIQGIPIDRYILNGGWRAAFQTETLKMLKIPEKKIIWSDNDTHIQADLLLVPGGGHGIFPRWAIDYLRYEFLEKREVQPRTGFERLYISRASASKRKLINEVEVMHYLHRFGFRSVTLETMPVTEQARLFASAKAVVAPHGAGLTNLMFCQPGTKVIEIFSPNHMHTCYPIISNHVKLDHYYLVGQGTRPPEYINPRNHADDITVNLKDLQHIMKMARLNR